jgi:hypothetical protein
MVILRLCAISETVELVKNIKPRPMRYNEKDLPEMFVDNVARFINPLTFNWRTRSFLETLRDRMDRNFAIVALGKPWKDLLELFKRHHLSTFQWQKRIDDYDDFWLFNDTDDEECNGTIQSTITKRRKLE